MTPKSRYFLLGAAALLLIGLGGGLVAYFGYNRAPGIISSLPAELRYVPADAEVVGYADVQAIMRSDLRRGLEHIAKESNTAKDHERIHIGDFAGVNVEKQVNHVVAYLESARAGASGANGAPRSGGAYQGAGAPGSRNVELDRRPPRALVLVQGTFEQPRIEQFIREHGGTIEDYNGKRIAAHSGRRPGAADPADKKRSQPPASAQSATAGKDAGPQVAPPPPAAAPPEMAVGFVQPGLIALGQADLVRRALDAPASGSRNVSENAELIKLINGASGSTAWVVGRFDAVSRRMGMPLSLTQQVPPLRLVSAKATINGGVKAVIRAETDDQAAADQVRDVVRGFVSLIRLQAGGKPELQETLKSIELSGSGNTVQLAFTMMPETFKLIHPPRRPRPTSPPAK
jgi:hypothetical protein